MTVASAQVTPYLPSGQQLRESRLPASAQSQLEELSLCILQKLLAPLVLPWRARRARRLLLESTLRAYDKDQVQIAAESALRYTSALGVAMPTLNGGTDTDGVGGAGEGGGSASGSQAAGSRRSSRPPRASVGAGARGDASSTALASQKESSDGGSDDREDDGKDPHRQQNTAAEGFADGTDSKDAAEEEEERSRDGDAVEVSASDSRAPELCAETLFTATVVSAAVNLSASPLHGVTPTLSASQQRAVETATQAITEMLKGAGTCMRAHVQEEWIQSGREPAHEVLVLLAGSLRRRCPALAVTLGGNTAGSGGDTDVASPTLSISHSIFLPSLPGSRRPSSAAVVGKLGSRNSTARPASTRRGAQFSTSLDGSLYGDGGTAANAGEGATEHCDILRAPLVLGELAVLGGFPYCEDLVVDSERCLIAAVSRDAYCRLIVTGVPACVQRRLMITALARRERLLPWFAPMTAGRLRLCPLLSMLGEKELAHVQDHLVPRVFAAGMVCSESTDPQHIFFIRRGLVRMEREGFANVERGAASSPKNRTLLLEGHTFGESPCIYRESLGDTYYALTHVDMYLVPFRVLIQLMKQQPEVQSTVYGCARAISVLREKDFEGVLRFNPGLDLVPGLQGVTTRRSSILAAAAAAFRLASRRVSPNAAVAASGSRGFGSRANSIIGEDLAPMLNSGLFCPSAGAMHTPAGTAPSRRVTIFEEDGTAAGHVGGGDGLVGGRVSMDLLAAMREIPLLRLVGTPEAIDDVSRLWRCVRYEKGGVIVQRGEECNRLLCFFEGRAAIVLDENALRREVRSTPFGTADLAVIAAAPHAKNSSCSGGATCGAGGMASSLQVIPAGHMIGYTCVLRHRWTRTVLAVDSTVEVWEISRAPLVAVLRKHGLERRMWTATQQVLQPLFPQRERFYALDYQPLVRPMPSSLWAEQSVVNVHPTRTSESVTIFPAWREGDFPLDRHTADASGITGR